MFTIEFKTILECINKAMEKYLSTPDLAKDLRVNAGVEPTRPDRYFKEIEWRLHNVEYKGVKAVLSFVDPITNLGCFVHLQRGAVEVIGFTDYSKF